MLWEMLAGRWLFLGETDLDTVRQVQSARIPSLSQLNHEVQPELERIVLKALARDPNQRYLTARDLGRDLSGYLFKLGHPVSSFEVATLVREAMVARESERRQKHKDDKVSIIGSLIDEAMVEFTSLDVPQKQRDGSVAVSRDKAAGGAAPLNLGSFEDVQDWTKDLDSDIGGKDDHRPSLPGDAYEAGNLAALEEDAPGMPLDHPQAEQRRRAAAPAPQQHAPRAHAQPTQTTPPKAAPAFKPTPQASAGSGAAIAIVLLVVAVAGAAGAYFGGLFH
jgi:serine/threonine-protein kinase